MGEHSGKKHEIFPGYVQEYSTYEDIGLLFQLVLKKRKADLWGWEHCAGYTRMEAPERCRGFLVFAAVAELRVLTGLLSSVNIC